MFLLMSSGKAGQLAANFTATTGEARHAIAGYAKSERHACVPATCISAR
jgi:hypothetical protein